MSWQAHIITLMPEAFPGLLGQSLNGRALEKKLWSLHVTALRDFGDGKHQNVDDTPAGGGAGMVLRADVAGAALDHALAKAPDLPIIVPSPRGSQFTQSRAKELAKSGGAIFFCPRFEGLDERVLTHYPIEEVSLGDYILSGGDLAAQIMIDATLRLLPGVMGDMASADEESFENNLLEYPHYTRPAQWRGLKIPEVLTSGDHQKTAAWRQAQAEKLTQKRRPDLWKRYLGSQKPKKD
ncbi:MAG: tRNA (guanosine(37)-N1)-methyltransferase TrmD [Parvibaculales bacterium]